MLVIVVRVAVGTIVMLEGEGGGGAVVRWSFRKRG